MPIRPLLVAGVFTPDEITAITGAFEDCLRTLKLVNRSDPAVTLVAKRVIALAMGGERDAILLRDAVLQSFGNDPGASGL
jgi:hypothetical protein